MAIRCDADGERLTNNASGWNYNAAYTVMVWVYISVDRNDWGYFMGAALDENSYDAMTLAQDGVTLQAEINAIAADGTTLNTGTWYHVTMVRSSATQVLGYLGTLSSAPALDVTHNHSSISFRSAATTFGFNPLIWPGQWLNGRFAYAKAWTTNLSLAEIQREAYSIRPVRASNLYGWWPIFPGSGERGRDYSGNGRSLTEGGTLTDEQEPPISWGAGSIFFPFTAAGGSQFNQSVSGTLSSAGAIIRQAMPVKVGALISAGAVTKQTSKSPGGTLTSAGTLTAIKTALVIVSGSLSSAGQIIKRTATGKAGALISAGAVVKRTARSVSGSISSAGALATVKVVLYAVAGSLGLSGLLARQTRSSKAGTVGSAGELNRQTQKRMAGTLSSAGALSAVRAVLVAVSGSLSGVGTLSKRAARDLSGVVASVGSVTKRTARSLAGTLASSGAFSYVMAGVAIILPRIQGMVRAMRFGVVSDLARGVSKKRTRK